MNIKDIDSLLKDKDFEIDLIILNYNKLSNDIEILKEERFCINKTQGDK